jgi:hypothetical protein
MRAMRLVGNFLINTGVGGRGRWHCSKRCNFGTIPVFALEPRRVTCEEPE